MESNYNLLIDLSWISHVYKYVFSSLSYNGISTGMYYGVYNLVKKLQSENPNFIIHICMDSRCFWRKKLFPAYKSNREDAPKINSFDFIELCRLLANIPNLHFYKLPDTEADDLIAMLVLNLKNTIIYSGDNDMLQLLPYGVKIADGYRKKDFNYRDKEYVFSRFGCLPEVLKYYRFLSGDKSDCIPKITNRIPEKELRNFAEIWYKECFDSALEKTSERCRMQILSNREQLRINIKLMDLILRNKDFGHPSEIQVLADKGLFSKFGIDT